MPDLPRRWEAAGVAAESEREVRLGRSRELGAGAGYSAYLGQEVHHLSAMLVVRHRSCDSFEEISATWEALVVVRLPAVAAAPW